MRHKRIVVKFFGPDGNSVKKTFIAPPKKLFTDASLEEVEEKAIEWLDKSYPQWNFRMVKVGPMQVNFVYDGVREHA